MSSFKNISNAPAALKCLLAALTIGLTACGGGDTATRAASAGSISAVTASDGRASIQRAASSDIAAVPVLTVRAGADTVAGVGALMTVRVDGNVLGTVEVKSATFSNFDFPAPSLTAGSTVDVVHTNYAYVNGQGRNLYISGVSSGNQMVLPTYPGVTIDRGRGAAAFDGIDVVPGQSAIYWNGALRLVWSGTPAADPVASANNDAARLLMQATFGPTVADISSVSTLGASTWIDRQMALPFTPDYVAGIQARYVNGDAWRPLGANFDPTWVSQTFWASTVNAPDQLRRRVGWALHQIFMVSQSDTNLWAYTRAYANYLDTLNKDAFLNYRKLLEDIALSPATGIYLSHMRNRMEDPTVGRVPDENFAREVMQLFSIGLYELNPDGTLKLDSSGNPIETYTNADVIAMSKVFTGFSWAFPDSQLTDANFRKGNPSLTTANDTQIDLQPMKAYPGQHSTAEKRLFSGKSSALTLPAGGTATDDLRLALDALFNHPNVGPFIGRQLIQHLVESNPSPAYVGRVAAVFNDDGQGVRGNLAAVVKAILLDPEARTVSADSAYGKLREPVLRVAHWMRAFNASSVSGGFKMAFELINQSEQALYAPSVFGYYRPGYVPSTSSFADTGLNAPEMQIVSEVSTAAWVNMAQSMVGNGIGWNGTGADVVGNFDPQVALSVAGNYSGVIDNLNLLLFAGQMSSDLRAAIADVVSGVTGNTLLAHTYRVRLAVFMALASNEFQVQH